MTEQEREQATAIVLALSRFPLAIDQAGAYLEETGCSLASYLHIYQQHQHELLARRGKQAGGYPDSVATTWSLAFERIEEHNPAAAELLRFCAFVAPDQIPEELLTEGASYWPAVLQEAVTDKLRFNQLLATLLDFSLIKRVGRERQLSLHRLVQVVQQARMTLEERCQWAQRFMFAVQAVFPREVKITTWQGCERLIQQVLACERFIEQHQLQFAETADLLERSGSYLVERGLYSQAEPLLRRALGIREQLLGPEHLDVATSLHNLGLLYWRQGKYAEAEPLYQRALRIRGQQLGPEHSDVAEDLNGLALLYDEQGKYAQAEPLYQRVLSIHEQQLGPEHHRVAVVLNNLGFLYTYQGKYAQAEPLLQRALHIWEEHPGPEHRHVPYSLNNLGRLYTHQGKYAEAELHCQRALRIWEEQLGPEHPVVASSLNNLAVLYSRQGKYAQAEPLYQWALRIREQQLGPEHLDTAEVLYDFAGFQQAQGRTREAASMYQRALTTREHVLGPEHPLAFDTRARLQQVLVALEQARETTPPEAESSSTTSGQVRRRT